jgi:hypothetical protein
MKSPPIQEDVARFFAETEGAVQGRIDDALVFLTGPDTAFTRVLCKIFQDGHLRDHAVVATSKRLLLRGGSWHVEAGTDGGIDTLALAFKAVLRETAASIRLHYGQDRSAAIQGFAGFGPGGPETCQDGILLLTSTDTGLVAHARKHGLLAGLGDIRSHRLFYSGGDCRSFHYLHAGYRGGKSEPGIQYLPVEPPQLDFPESGPSSGVWRVRALDKPPGRFFEGGPLMAVHAEQGVPPDVLLLGIAVDTLAKQGSGSADHYHIRDVVERTFTLYDFT